jgi:YHS domain-containing protein
VIVRALLRLLTFAALAVAGWWIARVLRGGAPRRRSQQAPADRAQGKMVRDRVCNTFLPQDRALETRLGNETFYFCSEACRSRFLQQAKVAESA